MLTPPCCGKKADGTWQGMIFMCINHSEKKFWLFQDFENPAIPWDNKNQKPLGEKEAAR